MTLHGPLAGCESAGDAAFGEPCATGDDCVSDFCVGGEAGGEDFAPFCSDDCTGRKTGDACGGGRGRCIADFVSWCWMPCDDDAACQAVNPARPVCGEIQSSGVTAPFKVCVTRPKP